MAATMSKYGSHYNKMLCEFAGLSTDTKPIDTFTEPDGTPFIIQNGSVFYEMDTDTKYFYDSENKEWKEV